MGTGPLNLCNQTETVHLLRLFDQHKDLDIRTIYKYLCPVIIVVCFCSIIFNAILVSISRQSQFVNKSPILLLSLNLALTDLIASLLNLLTILFNSYLPEVHDIKIYSQCLMLILEVFRCGALVASALHLLALAFVHYRGIVNPLHYRSRIFFSQHLSRTINIISVGCWLLPLTIMIAWFSSSPCQGFQSQGCEILFLLAFTYRYMVLTMFALPLLLMSIIYVRIFVIISRHQKGRRLTQQSSASASRALVSAPAGPFGSTAYAPDLVTNNNTDTELNNDNNVINSSNNNNSNNDTRQNSLIRRELKCSMCFTTNQQQRPLETVVAKSSDTKDTAQRTDANPLASQDNPGEVIPEPDLPRTTSNPKCDHSLMARNISSSSSNYGAATKSSCKHKVISVTLSSDNSQRSSISSTATHPAKQNSSFNTLSSSLKFNRRIGKPHGIRSNTLPMPKGSPTAPLLVASHDQANQATTVTTTATKQPIIDQQHNQIQNLPSIGMISATTTQSSPVYEAQRRHLHASAVPQTNTKALITTLLILGTYFISYVPAIIFQALTCVDYCPYPLYEIPYSRRVLLASITTILLIAKSIIDPFIYSYRMNEIQLALKRYMSSAKRRYRSTSSKAAASPFHNSQRLNNYNASQSKQTTNNNTFTNSNNSSSFRLLNGSIRSNATIRTTMISAPRGTSQVRVSQLVGQQHQQQSTRVPFQPIQRPARLIRQQTLMSNFQTSKSILDEKSECDQSDCARYDLQKDRATISESMELLGPDGDQSDNIDHNNNTNNNIRTDSNSNDINNNKNDTQSHETTTKIEPDERDQSKTDKSSNQE